MSKRCEKCGDSFLCAEHAQVQCGLSCPPDWPGHWRDWHSEDHNCATKGRAAAAKREPTGGTTTELIAALRDRLAAAEKKLELKWLIEEQLGAALARAETAERELDMANTRLRLLAHIEDNAVELVELRAERARHAEELARVVAISKDLEREARVTGDRIKVLGTRLADSCRLACREVLRKARAERSPQVDEWIASAIHAARSMIEAGKNDDAVAAAEAERDRLREILRRIASMDQPDTCVDCSTLYPGDGASWCWFCTAREALGEVGS